MTWQVYLFYGISLVLILLAALLANSWLRAQGKRKKVLTWAVSSLLATAVLGGFTAAIWVPYLPFNKLTSIEVILAERGARDVQERLVELKCVQIPEYSDYLGISPVRYDDAKDRYNFLVHDGAGNKILVTVRSDKIGFEPKPKDYVRVEGKIFSSRVDRWLDTGGLHIEATDVERALPATWD